MKKFILSLLAIAGSSTLLAQNAQPVAVADTTAVEKAIVDSVATPACCHTGKADNNIFMSGPYFGFLGTHSTGDLLDVKMGKSFEVGVMNLIGYERLMPWRGDFESSVTAGLGINWRIYTLDKSMCFNADANGVVGLATYPAGVLPVRSNLHTFNLQFPILWHQKFPGRILGARPKLSAGVILNWNTFSAVTTSWNETANKEVTTTFNGLHQRRFSVDLFAGARVCPFITLGFRYSPVKVFAPEYGPSIAPWSLTFIIGL